MDSSVLIGHYALVLLTKVFRVDQFEAALESWDWIGLEGRRPVLCSLFGDVFLQAQDGFWFLDTVEGTLTQRWPDRDTLQRELDTADGQDEYLLGGLAMAAERGGLTLGADQVYDFVQPPILGGQFTVENMAVMDFVVSLHIAGQLLRKVRELPPGTKITGFTVDGS